MRKKIQTVTRHTAGRPVANKYKVRASRWKRWSRQAQRVFNLTYYSMRPKMQHLFLHPKAVTMSREHWETIRWNAAWIAADAADEITLTA